MRKDLQALAALQQIDLVIDKLKDDKSSFPKRVDSLKAKLDEEKQKVESKKATLNELEAKKRSLEQDLKEKEEKVKKSNERLMGAKNNEEYKAHQTEIETAKKEASMIEEQALETLIHIDTQKEKIAEFEKGLAHRAADIENEIKGIQDDYGHIDEQVSGKTTERQTSVESINSDLISAYDRIRVRLKLAVATTVDGKCSSCDVSFPPQLCSEIQKGELMHHCPNCSRIMVARDK